MLNDIVSCVNFSLSLSLSTLHTQPMERRTFPPYGGKYKVGSFYSFYINIPNKCIQFHVKEIGGNKN